LLALKGAELLGKHLKVSPPQSDKGLLAP